VLSALLLAGLFAAPIATVALFVQPPQRGRGIGAWPWARRFVLAIIGSVLLTGAAVGLLAAVGGTGRNLVGAAIAIIAVSLAWLPFTRRWSARAHLCWAATTYLFLAYLVFMIWWTFASNLGPAGTTGGILLWVLELLAAFLAAAYMWELCDALGREAWVRRVKDGVPTQALPPADQLPFVSLHVPAYNEPPDMVIETLKSLVALDYPHFEIVVLDDNTTDESMWRPVEAWCHEHGVKFVHLADWPGYKSGALNYALHHMIDPRTELIGVIDSDYQLEPDFLRRCAPLFADPTVGFIQAPQDYRDWEQAPFYRRLYYSYKYFFAVSQPSRNERDGAIFAGTMGLIRRSAIDEVGGWDEWCITEDAELSLRLLAKGWSGIHVDRSFGIGVMPLTFEALKGQRFRWCFGGIQILRRHWRLMMPGVQTEDNQLSLGQRWAYLSGALQWYGDLIALLFFFFLLVGAANVGGGGGLLFRKLTGFLLAAIPLLVVLGLVRAVALLRRGTGARWRDALGAFMIWQSTALVVARASVQALFAKEAEFLRTPKTAEDTHWWTAIRGNRAETALAVLGIAGIAAALFRLTGYGWLTAALLVWPTAAYAAAPINSLAARRAALPADLRARRRSEYQRYATAGRVTVAAGGLLAVGGAAAAVVALLSPGGAPVLTPDLLGPARGTPAHYGHPATPGATPTPGSSLTPTPGGSNGSSPATSTAPSSTASATATASKSARPSTTPSKSTASSPTPKPSSSPTQTPTTSAAAPSSPSSPASSPSTTTA
jgi:glycosyltransferase involved in cell wall biosynthesis